MAKSWEYLASNSLEHWNPINDIKDPIERFKAKKKANMKSFRDTLKIQEMEPEKYKKKKLESNRT